MSKEKIVVLTGAGISAESGIKTFRDADGLWEGHDVTAVATPEGFRKDPELVLEFYNQRRKQLHTVKPNAGHLSLVDLEKHFEVHIVTQNVDDLHERAGSSSVTHLHGELTKIRSVGNPNYIKSWHEDLNFGDHCPDGHQLRPHIVWFGEAVPEIENAVDIINDAHYVIIVGTSMQVYPAAGLVSYSPMDAHIFYVDPKPSINHELSILPNLRIIPQPASTGVPTVVSMIINNLE